ALRRRVVWDKREGLRMPHPARERLAERRLMPPRHIQKRRSAGAAVEVLVATAHREVHLGGAQVYRQRARRMRQVPERQRALLVRLSRQVWHVEDTTRLIVDMSEHERGDFIGQALGKLVALDEA